MKVAQFDNSESVGVGREKGSQRRAVSARSDVSQVEIGRRSYRPMSRDHEFVEARTNDHIGASAIARLPLRLRFCSRDGLHGEDGHEER